MDIRTFRFSGRLWGLTKYKRTIKIGISNYKRMEKGVPKIFIYYDRQKYTINEQTIEEILYTEVHYKILI